MGKNASTHLIVVFLKSTVSPEQLDEIPCYLDVDKNSWKLKVNWKGFEWAWSKMVVVTLKNKSWEWINVINWLLNHFSPVSHSYTPRKGQKTKSFQGV